MEQEPFKSAPPKKPLESFFLFREHQSELIKHEIPNASPTIITSVAAQRWKDLPQNERDCYIQLFQEASENYKIELQTYEAKYGKIDKKSRRPNKMQEETQRPKFGGLLRQDPDSSDDDYFDEDLISKFQRKGASFAAIPPTPAYEVMIRNLAKTVTEQELLSLFPGCEGVFIHRDGNGVPTGTAFLKLVDEHSIQQALEFSRVIHGNSMGIERMMNPVPCRKILLCNIDHQITNDELVKVFKHCGEIDHVQRTMSGFSFITFKEAQSAEKALLLNGLVLKGCPVRICMPNHRDQAQTQNVAGVAQNNFGGGFGLSGSLQANNILPSGGLFGGLNHGLNTGGLFGNSFNHTNNSNNTGGSWGPFSNPQQTRAPEQQNAVSTAPKSRALSMLESLYMTKRFADMKFEVQGEELLAHKLVLAERSKVFGEMINNVDPEDVTMMNVKITDFDPQAFKAFLEYLYCDTMPEEEDKVRELAKLARMYVVVDLEARCEELLGRIF